MNLVIFDSIEEAFCIQVRKGTLNMYVAEDITLTNSGLERSAIDIWPGARLNLYIESGKTLTVDSGKGKVGADSSTYAGPEYGGQGGYAGIHVPKNYVVADTTRDTYEASLKTNEIGEAVLTLQGDGIPHWSASGYHRRIHVQCAGAVLSHGHLRGLLGYDRGCRLLLHRRRHQGH